MCNYKKINLRDKKKISAKKVIRGNNINLNIKLSIIKIFSKSYYWISIYIKHKTNNKIHAHEIKLVYKPT